MLKKVSTVLLFLSTTIVQAQVNETKKIQFGFSLGANTTLLKVKSPNNVYRAVNNFGADLGILSEYALIPSLSVIGLASFSFNNGMIIEDNPAPFPVSKFFSKSLDFGINLKYKIKPGNNFSPYLIIGPAYQINLDKVDYSNVFLPKNNLTLDLGFGVDKKLTYYNFSPALKYSLGLTNVNTNPAIKSVYAHYLKLVINFKN